MCKYSVATVNNTTVYDSKMPWPWYQRHQINGVHGFGVSSNLTGRRIQSIHSDSGKTSPLLRLNSVGEISSDTEQGVWDQNLTMEPMANDATMKGPDNGEKYPYTHATEDQSHLFQSGIPFLQGNKVGFNPYQQNQVYTMPQPTFANPLGGMPQVYGYPGVRYQGFQPVDGAWTYQNSQQQQHYIPQGLSLFCSFMGGQPVYQGTATTYPVWNECAVNNQFPTNRSDRIVPNPKSRMNPNAKPFTPQSMRQKQAVSDSWLDGPDVAIRDRQETVIDNCESKTTAPSDKEGSEEKSNCDQIAENCAAQVYIAEEPSGSVLKEDNEKCQPQNDLASEESNSTVNCASKRFVGRLSLSKSESDIVSDNSAKDERTECDAGNASAKENCSEFSKSGKIHIEGKSDGGLSFTAVVSLNTNEGLKEANHGRNTYILSRPRLKKKSKPSAQERKRRKQRVSNKSNDATQGSTNVANEDQKADSPNKEDQVPNGGHMTFILGSASSEDSEDDSNPHTSILISPLQCDSESGDDSDWDEVDGVSSAADFLSDQMCELLQPFMLSVLTVPCSSLPKSASAPHLSSHSLDAVNRKWSAVYNASCEDVQSVGAKDKKVHFAQEEDNGHPLKTFHPVEEYCRRGPWERYAADRCRFKTRIADMQAVIDPVLAEGHRQEIFTNRFAEDVS